MGLFGPSSSPRGPLPPRASQGPQRFGRNIIYTKQINQFIERNLRDLPKDRREFLKAKFEFGRPGQPSSSRISHQEFDKIVNEMERNMQDPIGPREITRLRELKGQLFR